MHVTVNKPTSVANPLHDVKHAQLDSISDMFGNQWQLDYATNVAQDLFRLKNPITTPHRFIATRCLTLLGPRLLDHPRFYSYMAPYETNASGTMQALLYSVPKQYQPTIMYW